MTEEDSFRPHRTETAPQQVGFKAKDAVTALQMRKEWMDQCSKECGSVLTTDDLSSQSSDWDGDHDEEEDEEKKDFAAVVSEQKDKAKAEADSYVDNDLVQFGSALDRFATARLLAKGESAETASMKESPVRRWRKVQKEVDALCAWAEARNISAGSIEAGAHEVAHEASRLGREVKDVSHLVQRAMQCDAQVDRGMTEASSSAAPKQIWLPSSERSDVAAVKNLLEMKHRAGRVKERIELVDHLDDARVKYEMSAPAGKQGAGWQMAAEVEAVAKLEARVKYVTDVIGAKSAAGAENGSLLDTVSELDHRLHVLQSASDDASCERLKLAIQLCCNDIDAATAQADKLEVLENEEREHDIAMAAQAEGQNFEPEETPEEQIGKLYQEISSITAVVERVQSVSRQLAAHDAHLTDVAQFARDLAGAEERTRHATETLQATVEVANAMNASAARSREQLQKNVKAIEEKIAAKIELEKKAAAAAAEAAKAAAA